MRLKTKCPTPGLGSREEVIRFACPSHPRGSQSLFECIVLSRWNSCLEWPNSCLCGSETVYQFAVFLKSRAQTHKVGHFLDQRHLREAVQGSVCVQVVGRIRSRGFNHELHCMGLSIVG